MMNPRQVTIVRVTLDSWENEQLELYVFEGRVLKRQAEARAKKLMKEQVGGYIAEEVVADLAFEVTHAEIS